MCVWLFCRVAFSGRFPRLRGDQEGAPERLRGGHPEVPKVPREEREPREKASPSTFREFLLEVCPVFAGRGGDWRTSGYLESLQDMFAEALAQGMVEAEGKPAFTY